jgi:hypothetical protein
VKLVAENFVPVALNTDRLPDTDDGKFFRALMKQWPQGLWVVAPDGKVLGFHYHKAKPGESYADGQKRWLNDTIEMLRTAVKDAGQLTVREVKERPNPFADRGRGVGADGGVRLAVSVIGLRNGRQEGAPVVDSIRLSREQWAGFVPPEGKATLGQEWTLPEAVARKFTPALSPMTDPIFSPTPDDATAAKITAKVERVAGGIAVIRFAGQWETAHNRDGDPKFPIRTSATADGVGVFDTKTGKMTATAWVLSGSFHNGAITEKPRPTAAIIEWTAGQ